LCALIGGAVNQLTQAGSPIPAGPAAPRDMFPASVTDISDHVRTDRSAPITLRVRLNN
jgi:hypothetical protein